MDGRSVELSEVQPEVQGNCSSNICHFYVLNIVGAEANLLLALFSTTLPWL